MGTKADPDDSLTAPTVAPDSTADAHEYLTWFASQFRALFDGFYMQSMNGVICSIPDGGLETEPHRMWCARCRHRWMRFKALIEMMERTVEPKVIDLSEVDPETLAILREIESRPPQTHTPVGPKSYGVVTGKPVVRVSQHTAEGGRVINFAELTVSNGIDPVAFAVEIAAALQALSPEAGLPQARGSSGITTSGHSNGERAGEHQQTPVLASSTLDQLKGYVRHVTRLEVIDEYGRVYTNRGCVVEPSLQDDGRTLKLFVKSLDALLSGSGQ